jgi:hypothetical protein
MVRVFEICVEPVAGHLSAFHTTLAVDIKVGAGDNLIAGEDRFHACQVSSECLIGLICNSCLIRPLKGGGVCSFGVQRAKLDAIHAVRPFRPLSTRRACSPYSSFLSLAAAFFLISTHLVSASSSVISPAATAALIFLSVES